MRRVRIMGMCLVAICAVVAIAASSASAGLPEWGQCYAKAGGKYADKNCQTKAKKGAGAFEWRKSKQIPVEDKKFEGHNVGSGGVLTTEFRLCSGEPNINESRIPRSKCLEEGGTILTPAPQSIECESETNHGEATGTKEVKGVTVVFRGCKLNGTTPCSNGPEEGQVVTNPLKGTLGYIKKLNKGSRRSTRTGGQEASVCDVHLWWHPDDRRRCR